MGSVASASKGGRSNPPATARCGGLLPSASVDVRASDDVVANAIRPRGGTYTALRLRTGQDPKQVFRGGRSTRLSLLPLATTRGSIT